MIQLLAAVLLALAPVAAEAGSGRQAAAKIQPAAVAPARLPQFAAPIGTAGQWRQAGPAFASTAEGLLQRLPGTGIAERQVAEAIAGASSVDGALESLIDLGLMTPPEKPTSEDEGRAMLGRLWDNTSKSLIESRFPIDNAWAVPALTVKAPEATYLVHPINHGILFPVDKKGVTAVADQAVAAGHALYLEQGVFAHYGLTKGEELNDHAVAAGRAYAVPRPYSAAHAQETADKAGRRALAVILLAAAGAAAMAALDQVLGSTGLILGGLGLAGAFWIMVTGRRALYAYKDRSAADAAANRGSEDAAAQLRREAAALHRPRLDPMEVMRLSLPPALSGSDVAARDAAMAETARNGALATDAKVVHIVAGHVHAAAVAWLLSKSKDPQEGSQHA